MKQRRYALFSALTLLMFLVTPLMVNGAQTPGPICGPFYLPDFGTSSGSEHYYQIVTTDYQELTWSQAVEAAENLPPYKPHPLGPTYYPHLVTITSGEEWGFIQSIMPLDGPWYWLGATDENVEGTWTWVTGEEFSLPTPPWLTDEPNNSGGVEDYLEGRNFEGQYEGWNDNNINGRASGYIVEYERNENSAPASIPTLSGWGMIIMSILLVLTVIIFMQRRRMVNRSK